MGLPRGKPRTPSNLVELRGNPGHRARNYGEPEPIIPVALPDAPPFLTGYAREEWERTGAELLRLRLLSVVDLGPFAAYCQAFHKWRVAEEALALMATDPEALAGAMVVRSRLGVVVPNPLVNIARNASRDMVRYASEFGFTPAARSRLDAGPYGDVGAGQAKFGGLLAAGQKDG